MINQVFLAKALEKQGIDSRLVPGVIETYSHIESLAIALNEALGESAPIPGPPPVVVNNTTRVGLLPRVIDMKPLGRVGQVPTIVNNVGPEKVSLDWTPPSSLIEDDDYVEDYEEDMHDAPAKSLSLGSSIESTEEPEEALDELYIRMAKDLPPSYSVNVSGTHDVELMVEPWKRDEGAAGPHVGFDVRLRNDRSIVVGKAIYYPNKPLNSLKDLEDIANSFAHRNDHRRGPIQVRPPSQPSTAGGFNRFNAMGAEIK